MADSLKQIKLMHYKRGNTGAKPVAKNAAGDLEPKTNKVVAKPVVKTTSASKPIATTSVAKTCASVKPIMKISEAEKTTSMTTEPLQRTIKSAGISDIGLIGVKQKTTAGHSSDKPGKIVVSKASTATAKAPDGKIEPKPVRAKFAKIVLAPLSPDMEAVSDFDASSPDSTKSLELISERFTHLTEYIIKNYPVNVVFKRYRRNRLILPLVLIETEEKWRIEVDVNNALVRFLFSVIPLDSRSEATNVTDALILIARLELQIGQQELDDMDDLYKEVIPALSKIAKSTALVDMSMYHLGKAAADCYNLATADFPKIKKNKEMMSMLSDQMKQVVSMPTVFNCSVLVDKLDLIFHGNSRLSTEYREKLDEAAGGSPGEEQAEEGDLSAAEPAEDSDEEEAEEDESILEDDEDENMETSAVYCRTLNKALVNNFWPFIKFEALRKIFSCLERAHPDGLLPFDQLEPLLKQIIETATIRDKELVSVVNAVKGKVDRKWSDYSMAQLNVWLYTKTDMLDRLLTVWGKKVVIKNKVRAKLLELELCNEDDWK